MKSEEKQKALALRSQGWSYNQILGEVGVSKGTLSLWLRDVPLTGDPRVVRKGVWFFEKLGIPRTAMRTAMRVAIQIHPGLSAETAEAFWQEVTGLPSEQFHATRDVTSRASGGKRGNVQVYGTCQVRAYSTIMRQKVGRWMELALTDGPLV